MTLWPVIFQDNLDLMAAKGYNKLTVGWVLKLRPFDKITAQEKQEARLIHMKWKPG
jgi:hypothetical protein